MEGSAGTQQARELAQSVHSAAALQSVQTCVHIFPLESSTAEVSSTLLVLILLLVRELAKHLERTPLITVCVNPGYCASALRRNLPSGAQRGARLMEIAIARSTEEGSRILVWAAVGHHGHEDELRGAYVNLCKVDEPSDFALSKLGQEVQKRVWVRGSSARMCI